MIVFAAVSSELAGTPGRTLLNELECCKVSFGRAANEAGSSGSGIGLLSADSLLKD